MSAREVKGVREFLTGCGESAYTSSVVKALTEAEIPGPEWMAELKGMQRDNKLVDFIASVKKKTAETGDVHNSMQEGLRDLMNMKKLMTAVADKQAGLYRDKRGVDEERQRVYHDTEKLAKGALVGIASCVDATSTQLSDIIAAQTSLVGQFDFQIQSALSHLQSAKSLASAAGMKKLRVSTDDQQQDCGLRGYEQTAGFRDGREAVPLPSFAKFDEVGEPFALLKGTQYEKPFLSQFREKDPATRMYASGLVYRGATAAEAEAEEEVLEDSAEEAPPAPPRPADDTPADVTPSLPDAPPPALPADAPPPVPADAPPPVPADAPPPVPSDAPPPVPSDAPPPVPGAPPPAVPSAAPPGADSAPVAPARPDRPAGSDLKERMRANAEAKRKEVRTPPNSFLRWLVRWDHHRLLTVDGTAAPAGTGKHVRRSTGSPGPPGPTSTTSATRLRQAGSRGC